MYLMKMALLNGLQRKNKGYKGYNANDSISDISPQFSIIKCLSLEHFDIIHQPHTRILFQQ
jgi:hypothetical protein